MCRGLPPASAPRGRASPSAPTSRAGRAARRSRRVRQKPTALAACSDSRKRHPGVRQAPVHVRRWLRRRRSCSSTRPTLTSCQPGAVRCARGRGFESGAGTEPNAARALSPARARESGHADEPGQGRKSGPAVTPCSPGSRAGAWRLRRRCSCSSPPRLRNGRWHGTGAAHALSHARDPQPGRPRAARSRFREMAAGRSRHLRQPVHVQEGFAGGDAALRGIGIAPAATGWSTRRQPTLSSYRRRMSRARKTFAGGRRRTNGARCPCAIMTLKRAQARGRSMEHEAHCSFYR